MLGQAGSVFDDRSAAITQSRAGPESAPAIVVENLCRASVSLVERRNDALPRDQRLVSSKTSGDRAVEVCLRVRVLEAAADANVFELTHVQHKLRALCSRGMIDDRHKTPRNA